MFNRMAASLRQPTPLRPCPRLPGSYSNLLPRGGPEHRCGGPQPLRQWLCRSPRAFWSAERRFSHQRSVTGVADEGRLFSRACQRFAGTPADAGQWVGAAPAGLVAGVKTDPSPNGEAVVRLGGDGHLARLVVGDAGRLLRPVKDLRETVEAAIVTARGIMLYLATPAVFARGWRPAPEQVDERFQLTLCAAAVGRPGTLSGWALAGSSRGPRPQRKVVPAGSVYLYRANDATPVAELVKAMRPEPVDLGRVPPPGLRLHAGRCLGCLRSFDPVRAERSPT